MMSKNKKCECEECSRAKNFIKIIERIEKSIKIAH